jgi:hypothetical protein
VVAKANRLQQHPPASCHHAHAGGCDRAKSPLGSPPRTGSTRKTSSMCNHPTSTGATSSIGVTNMGNERCWTRFGLDWKLWSDLWSHVGRRLSSCHLTSLFYLSRPHDHHRLRSALAALLLE